MAIKKNDRAKPPVEFIDAKALFAVAEAMGYGADKYAPNDWRDGGNYSADNVVRYCAATIRHVYQHLDGELADEESKLLHLAHAAASALIALGTQLRITKPTVKEEVNAKPEKTWDEKFRGWTCVEGYCKGKTFYMDDKPTCESQGCKWEPIE